ncbi:MAG: hypothetical protein PHV87_07055, partial [Bacilli bacterium]|nr:hypothetical protein [Bacilli bacterium]
MKLKASDLINYEIKPFLFGVLFSRILPDPIKNNNPDKFYIYSLFKRSKAVLVTDFSFQGYAPELVNQYNFFSGYSNWEIHSVSSGSTNLRFYIYNDLNINASQFYVLVYKKLIANQWLIDEGLNDEKKSFIRGYMETRGSVDLTTP